MPLTGLRDARGLRRMPVRRPLQTGCAAALVAAFAVAVYAQCGVGLADNGDFVRMMTPFCLRPTGFLENNSARDTPEWSDRYFHFYLPLWDSGSSGTRPKSSVQLWWLPGAVPHRLADSRREADRPHLRSSRSAPWPRCSPRVPATMTCRQRVRRRSLSGP